MLQRYLTECCLERLRSEAKKPEQRLVPCFSFMFKWFFLLGSLITISQIVISFRGSLKRHLALKLEVYERLRSPRTVGMGTYRKA